MSRILLCVLLGVALSGSFGKQAEEVQEKLESFLPPSEHIEGLKLADRIATYPGAKLFDLIDGAGEIFMDYNFINVASAEYYREDPDNPVIVEFYQMKTSDDAYGIYAYYKPEKPKYINIGGEGHFDGMRLSFWKDVYFCKVYALDEIETTGQDIESVARYIEKRIKKAAEPPFLVRVFLTEGLNADRDSIRFFRVQRSFDNLGIALKKNILGLGRKTKGAIAKIYLDKEKKKSAAFFIIEYPDEKTASKAYENLEEGVKKSKEAENILSFQSGKHIIGTLDISREGAHSKINALVRTLERARKAQNK